MSVMKDAQIRGTRFSLELTDVNPGVLQCGQTRLEILGPSQLLAYRTTGGQNQQGRRLSPNTMSAVVRIWADDVPRLFLAGDIDELGYREMIARKPNISAETLVFPHYGGRPGTGDPVWFATSLMGLVGAQLVVFSFGRGQYQNPNPGIVQAVLQCAPGTHIACTQLSDRCALETPSASFMPRPHVSRGSSKNACCAGTIEISFNAELTYSPTRAAHSEFVDRYAPTALCRGMKGISIRNLSKERPPVNGIQDSPRRHRDVAKMADFRSKSAMVDRSRGHSRTPPLLNPRPSEDDPGRHAGRSAAALRLGALADHALLGVSSQPGGARPAICRCPFVGNGPQWEGRSVPHGAGSTGAGGRFPVSATP